MKPTVVLLIFKSLLIGGINNPNPNLAIPYVKAIMSKPITVIFYTSLITSFISFKVVF